MSESLLNEIRATKPVAPSALRDRVRALSAAEPAREPFLARFRWRQLVLVAPVALVLALSAATVIGLTREDVDRRRPDHRLRRRRGYDQGHCPGIRTCPAATERGAQGPGRSSRNRRLERGGSARHGPAPALRGGAAPARGRRRCALGSDEERSANRALARRQHRLAPVRGAVSGHRLGADHAPHPDLQGAERNDELSALGTIVGQRYGIEDLQVQADTLESQIEATQRQIAGILGQLESTTLSDANRAVLKSRLANARVKLKGLREGLAGTRAEARTATIYLSLTTEKIEPGAVGGGPLDNIKDVLAWEAIGLLYFVVVAGPFLLVGFLVWLALRLRRRQVDTRLLEQN